MVVVAMVAATGTNMVSSGSLKDLEIGTLGTEEAVAAMVDDSGADMATAPGSQPEAHAARPNVFPANGLIGQRLFL